ncbi:MAG: hypothetical protein KDC38_21485, partial [Planctomycetes bacterium]|nr:hypothetical protein [Planctomycetota bacterium]
MNGLSRLRAALLLLLVLLAPRPLLAAAPPEEEPAEPGADSTTEPTEPHAVENDCTDRVDNDGDMVLDCGDDDCHDHPSCQPDGKAERDDERCSDWVDNDEDGYLDCEDFDCQGVDVCMGSWDRELAGQSIEGDGGVGTGSVGVSGPSVELGKGEVEEDLQGRGTDKDGERTNY